MLKKDIHTFHIKNGIFLHDSQPDIVLNLLWIREEIRHRVQVIILREVKELGKDIRYIHKEIGVPRASLERFTGFSDNHKKRNSSNIDTIYLERIKNYVIFKDLELSNNKKAYIAQVDIYELEILLENLGER